MWTGGDPRLPSGISQVLCSALRLQCPWLFSPSHFLPSWVKSAVWLALAQLKPSFRLVFQSLKWVEGWVKLAPTCQWLLANACALKVRDRLSGSSSVCLGWVCDSFLWGYGWVCGWVAGAMCCVCWCVCILAEEGGAWEGGADLGGEWPEELAGEAEPLGVSELRLELEGNSSLRLPVSAVSGFLPWCPSTTRAGGPAPTVCKSWGNSPLFPSKGIFL